MRSKSVTAVSVLFALAGWCAGTVPAEARQPVDLPPTISEIPDITIDENQTLPPIPFQINDPDDPESGWAVLRSGSYSSGLVVGDSITVTGTGMNRQVNMVIAPDHFGVIDLTLSFFSKPSSVVHESFRVIVRQVKVAPSITFQPPDQGAFLGRFVVITPVVKGEPAPAAQWEVSADDGGTWTPIPNATHTSHAFTVTLADSGKRFRAVFTNSEGTVTTRAAMLTVRRRVPDDMDGDGLSDLMVWRGPTGTYYWLNSSAVLDPRNGFANARQYGSEASGDIPLTGDLNGDGFADPVVFRQPTGTWFIAVTFSKRWGSPGDVPFLGDVDGDRKADLIVWRPSDGTWYWLTKPTDLVSGPAGGRQWGNAALGDRPFVGDFDGDGLTDFAVWRASTGTWYWLTSSSGYSYSAARAVQWGSQAHGDVPLLGDFDGDGKSDPAVWRANSGTWFWLRSSNAYDYSEQRQVQWGDASLGDIPVVKEIDGDGSADLVVWRASTGTWYWVTSSTGYRYANAGAVPWGSAAAGDQLPRK